VLGLDELVDVTEDFLVVHRMAPSLPSRQVANFCISWSAAEWRTGLTAPVGFVDRPGKLASATVSQARCTLRPCS
jgi:hypothetical protein